MNSRMYDPLIAQFLSVDYLATDYPDYTPFAYAMNNPFKYTDPTGNAVLPGVTVRPTYDYGTASAPAGASLRLVPFLKQFLNFVKFETLPL